MSPGRAINCSHVQDLLDDYRRGKLLPGQRLMVEDHLAGCDGCRSELALREGLARQLRETLPAAPAAAPLSAGVLQAIRSASRAERPKVGRSSNSLLSMMLLAAVILISAVALYQVQSPEMADPDATIAASARQQEQLYFRAESAETAPSARELAAVPTKEAAPLVDSVQPQVTPDAVMPPISEEAAPEEEDKAIVASTTAAPGQADSVKQELAASAAVPAAPAVAQETRFYAGVPSSQTAGFSTMAAPAEPSSARRESAPEANLAEGRADLAMKPAARQAKVADTLAADSAATPLTTSTLSTTATQVQTTDTVTSTPQEAPVPTP